MPTLPVCYPGYPVPQSEQQGRKHRQVSGPSGQRMALNSGLGVTGRGRRVGCREQGRAWEGPG